MPAQSSGAASSAEMPSGMQRQGIGGRHHVLLIAAVVVDARESGGYSQFTKSPRRQARQWPQWPPYHPTPTRWPFFQPTTPAPTSSTTPAISWPGHARILDARPMAFLREHVAVTDAARLHAYANFPRARLRHLTFNQLNRPARPRHLRCFHCRHDDSPYEVFVRPKPCLGHP